MTIKIIIFSSLAILVFMKFRRKLRSVDDHDFYVFFAFESLLALLFLNIDALIPGAMSWSQVIAWIFLILSLSFALSGFYGLKKYGRTRGGLDGTSHLITQGVFRYIRHPLYSSLILLALGVMLTRVTLPALAACLVAASFLAAASRVEEKQNMLKFGQGYQDYIKVTKRYIPLIF